MEKKRVLAILTGGTVASAVAGGAAAPNQAVASRLEGMLQSFFGEREVEVLIREPWGIPGFDSSDLAPEHWVDLSRLIVDETARGLAGVIILHGTDTMAYTSAWLSLALEGIPIPVVLTGSQLTLDSTPDDVLVNLRGAAQVVCTGNPGVWIYFNWKLIPGSRAHKARAVHPDAYVAVNGIPVYFSPDWAREGHRSAFASQCWAPREDIRNLLTRDARGAARCVAWCFCAPGNEIALRGDERILGLIGFGSGNAPSQSLRRIVETFNAGKKPLILACSQAEGDRKNPAAYDRVGIATLAREGFEVWSEDEYSLEFMHALAVFALLADPDNPERQLERYLRRTSQGEGERKA